MSVASVPPKTSSINSCPGFTGSHQVYCSNQISGSIETGALWDEVPVLVNPQASYLFNGLTFYL